MRRVSKASNHFSLTSSGHMGSKVGNLASTISGQLFLPGTSVDVGGIDEFRVVREFVVEEDPLLLVRAFFDLFNMNEDTGIPASLSKSMKNLIHLRATSPVTPYEL